MKTRAGNSICAFVKKLIRWNWVGRLILSSWEFQSATFMPPFRLSCLNLLHNWSKRILWPIPSIIIRYFSGIGSIGFSFCRFCAFLWRFILLIYSSFMPMPLHFCIRQNWHLGRCPASTEQLLDPILHLYFNLWTTARRKKFYVFQLWSKTK